MVTKLLLWTMETNNKVLTGDLFTGEGERSSGKVHAA